MDAGNTVTARVRRIWTLIIAALLAGVPLVASPPVVRGGELPAVSLTYSVAPGAYDNAVRVGNVTDMDYPRIVVDRGRASPHRGTIYVLGLDVEEGTACRAIVVARSMDGGQTFEAPRRTDLECSTDGPSLSVGIDGNGTLYMAGWGPFVARSSDAGLSWTLIATLDTARAPSSLAVDPVTNAVYVAWAPLDQPWLTDASGPIRLSSSRDGGVSWTAPVDVLPNGSVGARPQMASFSNSVVVTLRLVEPTGKRVAAVASQDGGRTWGNITRIYQTDPCQSWPEPSIAASPSGLFAVSWTAMTGSLGCSGWVDSIESWVAVSMDRGRTFSTPAKAGGPPGWMGPGFGGAAAFDDASRLFVTWRSVTVNWSGTVFVASSTDLATFENASFALRLEMAGSNATAEENLAAGLNGTVYLAWSVFPASSPETGIFVRSITGEADGELVLRSDPGSSPIDVDLRNPVTNETRARVRWTGGRVSVPSLPPGRYDVWLLVGTGSARAGAIPIRTWGLTSFTLTVGVGGGGQGFPWAIPVGIAAGVALLGAALAGLHYTRIGREQVLQRKVRLLMYEYVRDNPGSSFAAVRNAMGLKNGVAAYHLGVLETQGLLHSESKRRHRWYYTNGAASVWKDLPLSPLQSSIIEAVRRSPGIGVRELARTLGRRSSPVAYNVTMLAREGVLRTERAGRMLHCYPAE